MIPTMMDSKIFEKSFDAWNLATVTSTVWGPESDMAQKAQKEIIEDHNPDAWILIQSL